MSVLQPAREFNLYIDESGNFMESSLDPRDAKLGRSQDFPSQIVGFIAPKELIHEGDAASIMAKGHKEADLSLKAEFHATDIKSTTKLCKLTNYVVEQMLKNGWQSVRLVNKEGVPYGNRVQCYTNMIAEFILRIFQQLSLRHPDERILIWFDYARFDLRRHPRDRSRLLPPDEYQTRVDEYIGRAAVWYGFSEKAARWQVMDYSPGSAKKDSELQICDLLSYITHGDFGPLRVDGSEDKKKLARETKEFVQGAFGGFNQTMVFRELLDRADRLIEEHAYGLALIALTEELSEGRTDTPDEYGLKIEERINIILDRLSAIGCRGRDPQLSVLIGWLDQIIGHQRTLTHGHSLTKLLQKKVASGLRERLKGTPDEGTLDWFKYALHRWALTAANHRGRAFDAHREAKAMNEVAPCLAHRLEHTSLLMEGFIVQAVHYTDCFDYDAVKDRMQFVADSLKVLSSVYQTTFTGTSLKCSPSSPAPSQQARFDLRAKALGTWAQGESLAGLTDSLRLAEARRLSQEAIHEFTNTYDKLRQYQYRCFLEAVDKNFAEARKYLARSLHPEGLVPPDFSHAAIDQAIDSYKESSPRQAFYLLHWLRLGALVCLSNDPEKREFLDAFNRSNLLRLSWCVGRERDYPAHGILRRLALIQAFQGNIGEAIAALDRLRNLHPLDSDQLVLATVLLAAQAEVSGILFSTEQQEAMRLLDCSKPRGLIQMLGRLKERTEENLPTMWTEFKGWVPVVDQIISGHVTEPMAIREKMLNLARIVGY